MSFFTKTLIFHWNVFGVASRHICNTNIRRRMQYPNHAADNRMDLYRFYIPKTHGKKKPSITTEDDSSVVFEKRGGFF